jgi:hypothetical protein
MRRLSLGFLGSLLGLLRSHPQLVDENPFPFCELLIQ